MKLQLNINIGGRCAVCAGGEVGESGGSEAEERVC